MSYLIAVEGLDGAGKHTFAQSLAQEIISRGKKCAVHTFPAYHKTPFAVIASDGLSGNIPDLFDNPTAMAMLFAADRYCSKTQILQDLTCMDYVILDRYVASNIAYTAARLHTATIAEMSWLTHVEFDILTLPRPDVQIYLDPGVKTCQVRAVQRADMDNIRKLDGYEKNTSLQHEVDNFYQLLVESNWISPWIRLGQEVNEISGNEILLQVENAVKKVLRT